MIYLISHNDIQDKSLEIAVLSNLEKFENLTYLTATQNLKDLRTASPDLSIKLLPFKKDQNCKANLFSVTEYLQKISREVYLSKGYLSNADQKYILSKVISYFYSDDDVMENTVQQMRYELFDLYQLMLFHNKEISREQITSIAVDYSNVESEIFEIYSVYQTLLKKICSLSSCLDSDQLLTDILGVDFLKHTSGKELMSFTEMFKQSIVDHVSNTDALFFDGFLFLNEIQRFIVLTAVKQKKPVFFISKQFSDGTGSFIFEQGVKELADELNSTIKHISLDFSIGDGKTVLSYVKKHFPVKNLLHPSPISIDSDNTIEIIKPFISREEELRYIAEDISQLLRQQFNGNADELIYTVNHDVAIVIAIDKEQYEERISNLFREVGLFVLDKEKYAADRINTLDDTTFEYVYFARKEFLETPIKQSNGQLLSYSEKQSFFEKYFMRIDINKNTRPIASYPIGQFVLELYKIICDGMSIEGFRAMLYSNWRTTTNGTKLLWSNFISDFKYIEIFFENKEKVDDWHNEVHKLILLKNDIETNPLYCYHPLSQVNMSSLEFFYALLSEIKELTKTVASVVGGIEQHLQILKSVVMKADKILETENDNLEFEQIIIKRLADAISDIGNNSLVNNLEAKYFAQNIRAMLTEWENQNQSETESTIRLNVVNLENMKNFKFSYFAMCESDKYPRKYLERFPFTEDIVNILKDEKYGIKITPHELKGLY
ncbi:MAG: hypothetical protein PHI32_12420 [Dysgonamonadaceae bacterium]|nr:hypothetical protein [Dysgonamonadaceae bacterium]